MRRCLAATGVLLSVWTPAYAAGAKNERTPTFTKDVAPILFNRCAECHRKGEVAPMSLLSYKDARPWAKAMKEKVLARTMPPWLADPRYGHFRNDRRLSDSEISTFAAWADSGAAEGDARDLPPAPKFEEGWAIGKPDAVIALEKAEDVPAGGVLPYRYITVPTNFTEDRWIQAAEIRPGNRGVVHHVIVNVLDADAKAGTGPDTRGFKLSGYAPGEQPKVWPAGTAKLVKAGSKFVFQLHYTPNGKATTDKSYIGVVFAKEPVKQKVLTAVALNARFVIPAGEGNHEVTSSWTAPEDVRIVDLMPHMHLRGKDFKYTAVYPDGRSEVVLNVPKYDFNWQLLYQFQEPLFLPKGARLDCVAHFDNSSNNKYNPDPTKEVKWGPQTFEEMMIGWFDYVAEGKKLVASADNIR